MASLLGYLHTGDYVLIGMTVLLILGPSQVPMIGNTLGRIADLLRGKPQVPPP
jgi:Sec-independent protein translocase protein TatA